MKLAMSLLLVILLSGPVYSVPVNAGSGDSVLYVYSCNDDVGIQMQTAGWVVVRQADVGQKRVDRIMAIALTLLATGKKTGYFNEGQPMTDWCGVANARPITVLGVLNQ